MPYKVRLPPLVPDPDHDDGRRSLREESLPSNSGDTGDPVSRRVQEHETKPTWTAPGGHHSPVTGGDEIGDPSSTQTANAKASAVVAPRDEPALTRRLDEWPDAIAGVGPKTIGPYDPCAVCRSGSWVRYGGVVICLSCLNGPAVTLFESLLNAEATFRVDGPGGSEELLWFDSQESRGLATQNEIVQVKAEIIALIRAGWPMTRRTWGEPTESEWLGHPGRVPGAGPSGDAPSPVAAEAPLRSSRSAAEADRANPGGELHHGPGAGLEDARRRIPPARSRPASGRSTKTVGGG